MFQIFVRLGLWVWDALRDKAETEQGGAELRDILDDVEAAGFDVPFYEPDQPGSPDGEPQAVEWGGQPTDTTYKAVKRFYKGQGANG